MTIAYFTPETFDAQSWDPNCYGYDPRQFLVGQCMWALANEGGLPRMAVVGLCRKLRGRADSLDPSEVGEQRFGIPDPDIGWNLNPALCLAEAARLRHMADYLEARLENYPDVQPTRDFG